jgi:MFS family permease
VVSQLDVSIVNVALLQISKSLSAGVSSLQWIVDAYTIAFAVFMLSAGGMSQLRYIMELNKPDWIQGITGHWLCYHDTEFLIYFKS